MQVYAYYGDIFIGSGDPAVLRQTAIDRGFEPASVQYIEACCLEDVEYFLEHGEFPLEEVVVASSEDGGSRAPDDYDEDGGRAPDDETIWFAGNPNRDGMGDPDVVDPNVED